MLCLICYLFSNLIFEKIVFNFFVSVKNAENFEYPRMDKVVQRKVYAIPSTRKWN